MTIPLFSGFLLGLSLILVIGAQNAFVLRLGLRGEHVLPVVLICAVSDAALILVGVLGFAQVSAIMPWAEPVMRYAGAAFLVLYGARSFRSAFTAETGLQVTGTTTITLQGALLTCLALTWLNPHVYLDTVVLIGSISTQFNEGRGLFALGAMLSSFTFFFSLGYGARLLRPFFARPGTWRVLDGGIGLVMWITAARLLLPQ
ncbi:putative L-lysine exporter [Azorhizobium caulinodans ORS 571]|uniref:AsiE n=1 Tax=Azorhizobium caulinodans (strain ATCC 43989 / DSM 5975 / JCM 20966 / LMG 6465 / NBRC 14845 / NCIMB 13405 / ORS 571) TaxID=438753 RepID=A8INX2_AZOC5|nr:LysE/ArgO family amino acid transporter [Azorhizobium caulinodans]ACM45328.1 AsiE [Azorhizobium caulinodans ORS 571]BAF89800.1 putative L-lysine exporter [Azorhizobium caulinodans ORS 571]